MESTVVGNKLFRNLFQCHLKHSISPHYGRPVWTPGNTIFRATNCNLTPYSDILANSFDPSIRMEALISASRAFVADYMRHYDSSHDMSHVLRVLSLAKKIEFAESQDCSSMQSYDGDIITLASLLHDVGDRKYLHPGEDGTKLVYEFLLSCGGDNTVATVVQDIVNHVSYSSEIKDPAAVTAAIARHPELMIVQDADRLDALGAIGIGRCFTYNASRNQEDSMEHAIEHFEEKLERLEYLMKTTSGRAMAVERTKRIKAFRMWWLEESQICP